ncbi:MAG: ATP-dependent zinc metalloprotease FtsH [Thermoguttaceae bacterium]|jgi:cell division protease FtsH
MKKTDLWENPKTALYMSGGSEDPLPGKEESESTGPTSETPPPEGSGSKDAGSGDDFPLNEETYRKIPDRFKQAPESSRPPVSKRPDSGKAKSEGGNPPPPPFKGGKQPTSGTHYPRGRVSPFLMVLLVAGIVWMFVSARKESRTTLISWNGFYEQLEKGNIDTVTLKGNILSGTFVAPPEIDSDPGKLLPEPVFHSTDDPEDADRWIIHPVTVPRRDADYTFTTSDRPVPYFLVVIDKKKGSSTEKAIYRKFRCEVPATALTDPNLDNTLRQKVRSFTSHSPIDNTGLYMITSVLLSGFLLLIFWRMMRRTNEQMMGGGIGGIMKSPMRSYDPNKNKRVTFADVAGLDNVKKELEEIVDYLKDPERYDRMGARVPKGSLLCGPPGTGKTLLARAVAGEAGVSFLSINGSEFMQMFVGVGATRVREIFHAARTSAPSILFIDEIDAVGRQRGTGLGGGHDEREQTLNQILSEMDGFVPTESVMVMAATNRPDVLDPALMRPGRFDRHITVDRPSRKGRKEIFDVYLKKIPKADDIDRDKLAASTVGFTGADIQNLVNEAALWATRNYKTKVDMSDFEFAHAKVIMGLPREEVLNEENKRKTAYHEAGHTIADWFSPTKTKVHKVTIIPRGMSLGATYIVPEEDQLSLNETEIHAKLTGYLAGRTAEKIVYHQTSTGAENDLKEATRLARRMVVHWGMSKKLGPVSYRSDYANPFLGREIAESREYSELTARLIDEEVLRILHEAEAAAELMLSEKRDLLEKLAETLIAEEEIDQDRIQEILGPPA